MSDHRLRADITKLEIVHTDELDWSPSPSAGVWRKRLELSGPVEAGRVTSVVRYDPGSRFSVHPHPEGEEILVLEGVFSDQRGDHPAGCWLLAPEGFEHAPYSEPGCTLFVKLRQYPYAGAPRAIDTRGARFAPHAVAGIEQLVLLAEPDQRERTHLLRLAPGTRLPQVSFDHGEEIFVIAGGFDDQHGSYRQGSWVRYPPGSSHRARSEPGCLLYVKKNHLR